MNEKERKALKSLIIQVMLDYKGTQFTRIYCKDENYLIIGGEDGEGKFFDNQGNPIAKGKFVAEAILEKLEDGFEIKTKNKYAQKWHE